MLLKKSFLLFIAVLLLQSDPVLAQRKHKHKEDATGNILFSKIFWRTFDINYPTSISANASLKSIYDSAGNKTNFNQVILKALKDHSVQAYNIVKNFKDLDTSTQDGYVYFDKDITDSTIQNITLASDNVWQKYYDINNQNALYIHKYFIVERCAFHKDLGQMVVNIQWIGACDIDTAGELYPVFAIKYPQLAPILKQYTLWDFCQDNTAFNCYDFFETRYFSSAIIGFGIPDHKSSPHSFKY